MTEEIDDPCCLAALPGGGFLVGDRDGTISRVSEDGEVSVAGTVRDVAPGGFLGLAVDPGFMQTRTNNSVYLYHTSPSDNRVVRLMYYDDQPPGQQLGTAPNVLLRGIPTADTHNGGALAFGPDGMLYVGTGEEVLRMRPDGHIPGDNAYSQGHTAVQGLAWDPLDRLWVAESGADGVRISSVPAKGDAQHGGLVSLDVSDVPAGEVPTGLAYSNGSLWMPTSPGQGLWRFPLDGTKLVDGAVVEPFTESEGTPLSPLHDALATPDGRLLLLTDTSLLEVSVT